MTVSELKNKFYDYACPDFLNLMMVSNKNQPPRDYGQCEG
jgi:hypothetical protein